MLTIPRLLKVHQKKSFKLKRQDNPCLNSYLIESPKTLRNPDQTSNVYKNIRQNIAKQLINHPPSDTSFQIFKFRDAVEFGKRKEIRKNEVLHKHNSSRLSKHESIYTLNVKSQPKAASYLVTFVQILAFISPAWFLLIGSCFGRHRSNSFDSLKVIKSINNSVFEIFTYISTELRIRIDFNADSDTDPDPAFFLIADPDSRSRSRIQIQGLIT